MRALPGVACALVVFAAAASAVLAASGSDLAVLRIRVPAHVRLGDARPTARARGTVRIANRGSVAVVVPDVTTLTAVIRLTAANLEGSIACPSVGIAPKRRSGGRPDRI